MKQLIYLSLLFSITLANNIGRPFGNKQVNYIYYKTLPTKIVTLQWNDTAQGDTAYIETINHSDSTVGRVVVDNRVIGSYAYYYYYYDLSNRITQEAVKIKINGKWLDNQQLDYSYSGDTTTVIDNFPLIAGYPLEKQYKDVIRPVDTLPNTLEKIHSYWSRYTTPKKWVWLYDTFIFNNNEGIRDSTIRFNGANREIIKTYYTYNDLGDTISIISKIQHDSTIPFYDTTKVLFTYDTDGKIISRTHFSLDTTNKNLFLDTTISFIYRNDTTEVTIVATNENNDTTMARRELHFGSDPLNIEYLVKDTASKEYNLKEREIIMYSESNAIKVQNSIEKMSFSVINNSIRLTINSNKKGEIFLINGRKIMTIPPRNSNNTTRYDYSSLPKGVYLFKVEGILTTKLRVY